MMRVHTLSLAYRAAEDVLVALRASPNVGIRHGDVRLRNMISCETESLHGEEEEESAATLTSLFHVLIDWGNGAMRNNMRNKVTNAHWQQSMAYDLLSATDVFDGIIQPPRAWHSPPTPSPELHSRREQLEAVVAGNAVICDAHYTAWWKASLTASTAETVVDLSIHVGMEQGKGIQGEDMGGREWVPQVCRMGQGQGQERK